METDNVFGIIIPRLIALTVGFIFIFQREKIVDALISSNKVFWEKVGVAHSGRIGVFITKVMIPFMGAIFVVMGIVLAYWIISHFFR